jgi:hypothetical protein
MLFWRGTEVVRGRSDWCEGPWLIGAETVVRCARIALGDDEGRGTVILTVLLP